MQAEGPQAACKRGGRCVTHPRALLPRAAPLGSNLCLGLHSWRVQPPHKRAGGRAGAGAGAAEPAAEAAAEPATSSEEDANRKRWQESGQQGSVDEWCARWPGCSTRGAQGVRTGRSRARATSAALGPTLERAVRCLPRAQAVDAQLEPHRAAPHHSGLLPPQRRGCGAKKKAPRAERGEGSQRQHGERAERGALLCAGACRRMHAPAAARSGSQGSDRCRPRWRWERGKSALASTRVHAAPWPRLPVCEQPPPCCALRPAL